MDALCALYCILHNVYYRTYDMSRDEAPSAPTALADLVEIMARLRDPATGCEWDRVQTFETIAPYTIEEAYEVADAIRRGDMAALKDELGDLQLQVVFTPAWPRNAAPSTSPTSWRDLRQDDHAAIRTSSATPPTAPAGRRSRRPSARRMRTTARSPASLSPSPP